MLTEWWTNQTGTTEKHLHFQEEKYMLKMLNGFLGNKNEMLLVFILSWHHKINQFSMLAHWKKSIKEVKIGMGLEQINLD
jgi:hypothetical protein